MTISTALTPPGAQDLLGRTLPHLLSVRPSSKRIAGGGPPKASHPLKVFTLTMDDALAPDPLSRALFVGWRYLIDDDGVPSIADIRPGEGEDPQFSNLTRGPFAKGLKLAAQEATILYGTSGEAFEARVLEVPSIFSVSLWLHGEHDVFFRYLEPNGQVPPSIAVDPNYMSWVGTAARDKAGRAAPPAAAHP